MTWEIVVGLIAILGALVTICGVVVKVNGTLVRLEDAMRADEIFTTLMGDKVEPRREFIEQNSKLVADLDV